MTNPLLVDAAPDRAFEPTAGDSATVVSPAPTSPGLGHRVWSKVRPHPLGAIASLYLVLLVIVGLMASSLAPYDPAAQDLSNVLSGPTADHWLGTDTLGRDLLSQLLYGIRPSLVGAVQASIVFLTLGVTIGIIAGYVGGRIDAIVGRTVDLAMSIPTIIMILVVLGVFPNNALAAMVALGVLASPGLIRVVRGSTLSVREELFVTAARVSGVRPTRIMRTHILRRTLGPILVQASLFAGMTLVFQAALSYLGLLSNGGRPTWGGMIGTASTVISRSSWPLVPPGVTIGITVLAFGLLGDALRDLSADQPAALRTARSRPAAVSVAPSTDSGSLEATPSGIAPDIAADPVLLEVRQLTISLGDELRTPLVTDVSFTVGRGETVVLVGESGCGKSLTALAIIGQLSPAVEVRSGQVVFDGTDLVAGGRRAYSTVRGRRIGYVSQHALASLDPTHTVGSHLCEIVRRHERISRSAATDRSIALLRQVKFVDPERVMASYPHELSGGMAQRVSIAVAIAGRPDLLVADEPTTALDVTLQSEILSLLRDLQDSTGLAILLITHDWGVVADIGDRAIVMYAGQVVEQAAAATAFKQPRFPYTAALLAANPSTAEVGSRLPMLPGRVPPPGSWPVGCRFADRCAFASHQCTVVALALRPAEIGSLTRCVRVETLVAEGLLPK
ncbi:MAG: dipeptide/oligopeptide/nickel ABC transporter permease/ATP-binding protein [Ilumatobacteraceae bacterium]